MSATGIQQEPTWDWSGAGSTLRNRSAPSTNVPGSFEPDAEIKLEYQEPSVKEEHEEPSIKQEHDEPSGPPPEYWESEEYYGGGEAAYEQSHDQEQSRTWPSRQCRICLEVVPPTILDFEALPDFMRRKPRVTYISEDPELGRLIRPCKCKGSSRYVHEGCLQQWRQSDTTLRAKNYWTCPTCKFNYRLSRMTWGRLIKSTVTQVILTVIIFFGTIFLLGFVADPIINLYLDPIDTLTGPILDHWDDQPRFPVDLEDIDNSWTEHFAKGIAGLGLLGAIKTFLTLNPWTQWSLRSTAARRAGQTGRDRFSSFTWVLIVTGVVTFLWTVWKGVRAWARRTLEKASETVMDIPLDDDEDDLVDPNSTTAVSSPQLITDTN